MDLKEAIEIISEYEPDCFDFEIEDAMFGDGSHTFHFPHVFDSKAEAEKAKEALQTIIKNAIK